MESQTDLEIINHLNVNEFESESKEINANFGQNFVIIAKERERANKWITQKETTANHKLVVSSLNQIGWLMIRWQWKNTIYSYLK